jgi:antitoxin component YwqK of YwqJK toxin-antitoxin module
MTLLKPVFSGVNTKKRRNFGAAGILKSAFCVTLLFQPTMHFFKFFLPLFVCLCCIACSKVETVEFRDDSGHLERYERLKKTYAKHGMYEKFGPNGQLILKARYQNDTLDGERIYFYPNGKTESVETFVRGIYHGPYRKYYDDGTLQVEQNYVNGAMEGWSLAYYPNGKLREKVMLKNNDENGPFFEYYENGVLQAEGQYGPDTNGDPAEQGILKEYDEKGQLVRTADCIDGRCTTRSKTE